MKFWIQDKIVHRNSIKTSKVLPTHAKRNSKIFEFTYDMVRVLVPIPYVQKLHKFIPWQDVGIRSTYVAAPYYT